MSRSLVVIDPGHGGRDPGAVAHDVSPRLRETDIAWPVAVAVATLLRWTGHRVRFTRALGQTAGVSHRAQLVNLVDAQAFVSIHTNAHQDLRAHGLEVLRFGPDGAGARLAEQIKVSLVDGLQGFSEHDDLLWGRRLVPPKWRGIKDRPRLGVLRLTYAPAALVELPFISNEDDRRLLTDGVVQSLFAKGIALGVEDFLVQEDRR